MKKCEIVVKKQEAIEDQPIDCQVKMEQTVPTQAGFDCVSEQGASHPTIEVYAKTGRTNNYFRCSSSIFTSCDLKPKQKKSTTKYPEITF